MLRLNTLIPCLLVATAVSAGEPATVAQLLPPRTPVFMETRQPPMAELKQLAMFQCLHEPGLKAVLDQLASEDSVLTSHRVPLGPASAGLEFRSDFRDMSLKVRYVDPQNDLTFRIGGRFALAWIGLAQGPIPVDALVAVEIRGDAAAALETLKRIVAAASLTWSRDQSESRSVDVEMQRLFSTAIHAGVEYTRLAIGGVTVYLGTIGSLIVATTTEERMKECIDRAASGPAGSLATDARYSELVAKARGTGTATTVFVIQVDRTFDALEQVIPGPIAMARAALGGVGLGGLKSLTSVSRVDGRGITNSMSILVDRKEGAALLGPGRPARYGCLAFAPKQSFYVNCSSIDVGKFHAMARGFPDPWFQQAFGLRFKQDLVDLLGPEMALIVAPNQGLVPDIGFAFESKDAAHLARSLLKMAKAIRWPAGTGIQRAKILGVAAHVLPLGHPRLAEIPIAPTFGVVDGRLLIAPSPLAFRRFVAVQQGRQPNLSANRDFAKLRELVPERAEGLSYLNLPRLVGFAYDTAVPFLQAMPQPAGAGPLYQLPESDVFTRHLYGRIAWMVTDERGMHWVSHSPLDMSGFLLGGIGAGVGAWVTLARQPEAPVPIRADAQDLEAMMCEDRVRRLSTWLRYYRRQHKALPASLDDLKSEDRSDDSFLVPGTKRGYVYFGPKGRNGVLLHGFANGRDKRVCILTRGMKVRRVTAKQLSEMLAKRSASRDR